jgi:hypothetical protein
MPGDKKPHMHDPADTELHSKSKKPYPEPGKTKVTGATADDTADPAARNPKHAQDRGGDADGTYDDANTDMLKKVKDEKQAWKDGKTQNR